jgi:hypothetical protein
MFEFGEETLQVAYKLDVMYFGGYGLVDQFD